MYVGLRTFFKKMFAIIISYGPNADLFITPMRISNEIYVAKWPTVLYVII